MRFRAAGRGRMYTPLRGLIESTLRICYRGNWPRAVWGALPGTCDVRVVRHRLPLLPAGARPVRVAFASDLHIGPTTPPRLLDEAFAALRAARPDILLLGGDYVFLDATPATARELAARVASVPAAVKLAVLGNHDLWTEHERLEEALAEGGAQVLVNRSVALEALTVVGLDDPWTGALDGARAFAGVDPDRPAIVLCHSPDGLPEARSASLYVCGHTHGGHVATPWGPLYVPGPHGKRHPFGLYQLPGLTLYVSRGLGGIEIPIRLYAPPEVAVFDLEPGSFMGRPSKTDEVQAAEGARRAHPLRL